VVRWAVAERCSVCDRAFQKRATVLLLDGKLLHLRCENRGQKRLSAKRSRLASERSTRRKRKAIDADAVFARDRGICAICRFDTTRIGPWLESLPRSYDAGLYSNHGELDRFSAAVAYGTLLGRHRNRALVLLARFWGVVLSHGSHFSEIDHITPIAEGGSDELSNLRTLCRRCHCGESAALRVRLARRPTKSLGRGFA
jgi:5-methylcytosine-specific restriction endonuclease McrA